MIDDLPRKRGRPFGTVKREHAYAAARGILDRRYRTVRDAALEHFAAHTNSKAAPLTMAQAVKLERFSDFESYVETALRDLIKDGAHSFRGWRALKDRNRHRSVQPVVRHRVMNGIKLHLNDMLGWNLTIHNLN